MSPDVFDDHFLKTMVAGFCRISQEEKDREDIPRREVHIDYYGMYKPFSVEFHKNHPHTCCCQDRNQRRAWEISTLLDRRYTSFSYLSRIWAYFKITASSRETGFFGGIKKQLKRASDFRIQALTVPLAETRHHLRHVQGLTLWTRTNHGQEMICNYLIAIQVQHEQHVMSPSHIAQRTTRNINVQHL